MTEGPRRAEVFTYRGLDVNGATLEAHYRLDDVDFTETVTFEGPDSLDDAARAAATLWYLIAGLSYYKAGAARVIDLADTPVGPAGRALLEAALRDGLGEFSVVNDLALDDVAIEGGAPTRRVAGALDASRVLVPFGGGIDSIVSVEALAEGLDRALFIVSPRAGRFAALEDAARVTDLEVVRAERTLDGRLLEGDERFLRGHVPISAMISLLGATAAAATGRAGVVMSNEHSASVPNLTWRGRDVNHQWSKSLAAEVLIANALDEVLDGLCLASLLRDRSEIWVAERFSRLTRYHHVFRSCNRAFTQDPARRASTWCGECDKCLFIALVLAPFLAREELAAILGSEPLADPAREAQLEVLVGLGSQPKPFECVGDPTESATALAAVASDPRWSDVTRLGTLAARTHAATDLTPLLAPQGTNRVPAHWLR